MVGIILSSKFIVDDLSVEFGKILPSELPLFNKPLVVHQLEYLKNICKKIYITIPEKYNVKFNYTNIEKLYISNNLNLLELFENISCKFNEEEFLFIHYGDTVFKGIDLNQKKLVKKNIFFVKTPVLDYSWGPYFKNTTDVPAGGFIIQNKFFKKFLKKSKTFNEFANIIFTQKNILKYSEFEWFDFGHALTYYQSRQLFLETRYFNSIKPVENFLRKQSSNIFKMWCEYNWMMKIKCIFPSNVPFVTNFSIKKTVATYDIEYVNKAPLSDIFVFGNISEKRKLEILNNINIFLKKLHSAQIDKKHENISNIFMYKKLLERKQDLIEFILEKKLKTDSYYKIIDNNLNYFEKYKTNISIIHGDFCFSNLIYNTETENPIIIDPRGFLDEEVGFTHVGPSNYDIFKLAHSYIAGYDHIIADYYPKQYFTKQKIKDRFVKFNNIFKLDQNELTNGIINLFLSMIPLHKDNKRRQESFLEIAKKMSELW